MFDLDINFVDLKFIELQFQTFKWLLLLIDYKYILNYLKFYGFILLLNYMLTNKLIYR